MAKKSINTEKRYINERFYAQLEAMRDYPLTVLEAPMGYGKTTGLKAYLRHAGLHYSWITAVEGSRTYFWEKLCKTFTQLDPSAAWQLQQCGFPKTAEDAWRVSDIMADLHLTEDTLLVIDDYQHIYDEPMAAFLSMVAANEIPCLHFVLAGRQRFLRDREEMVVKHRLHVIDAAAIRMEPRDIQKYYHECGIALTHRQAAALFEATDGWVTALYLNLRESAGHFQEAIPGRIYDLLDRVLYQRLAEDEKDILQRLSVFRSFSMEQARFVRRKNDPQPELTRFVNHCDFLFRDPDSGIYHMNVLLAHFVRQKLEKREIRYRNEVFRHAADWYYLNREYGKAAFFYYRSGHFEDTLKAFERDGGKSLSGSEIETMHVIFSACPDRVRDQHPLALLIYARQLAMMDDWARLRDVVDLLQGFLEDGSIGGSDQRRLRGEILMLESFLSYTDPFGMVEAQEKAASFLNHGSQSVGRESVWAFGSPSMVYLFHAYPGRLSEEYDALRGSRNLYYRMTDNNSRGSEYLMEAELLFYRGELQKADILANKAINVADRYRQVEVQIGALFLHARIAMLTGAADAGAEAMRTLRALAADKRLHRATCDMCEAAIYAIFNQLKPIASWIAEGRFINRAVPGVYNVMKDYLHIIYGKILLDRLEYSKYLGISQVMLEEAVAGKHVLPQIYIHLFDAAAYRKSGMFEQAERSLHKAVSLAARDGVVIPFVENGNNVRELLKRVEFEPAEHQFVQTCLKLGEKYERNLNVLLSEAGMSPLSMLTRREQEISLLVAEGKTNMQIARELNVAEITVKKSLSNIYARLGVANRTSLLKKIME